ncbi:MAG: hypothetical protein LBN95_06310, partial [Prevotellaceae bacterium]|nr:hypothetical protein [Prevotellaceae bacterium]
SEAHKYSVMLPSVNYDKVRFYRVPPGELISNQEWGWNKTGELPFDYAVCNHYVMTTSVWQPGDNDYQYFQDCGFAAGIENVFANKEVERVEYYNLQGLRLSAEPQEGLFIAVPFYKGNVRGEAVKVLNVR